MLKFNICFQLIKLFIPDGQNGKCCRSPRILYFRRYRYYGGSSGSCGHVAIPVATSSVTLPFVENISRARAVKEQIDAIFQQTGIRPLVFYSIVLPEIRDIIVQSEGFCQDIVQALVAPLQQELRWTRRQSLTAPTA